MYLKTNEKIYQVVLKSSGIISNFPIFIQQINDRGTTSALLRNIYNASSANEAQFLSGYYSVASVGAFIPFKEPIICNVGAFLNMVGSDSHVTIWYTLLSDELNL